MVQWIWNKPCNGSQLVEEARVKMIRETSVFLTWALAQERHWPRIPRRLVNRGGFGSWLSQPGTPGTPGTPNTRRMVAQWWNRALARISLEQ